MSLTRRSFLRSAAGTVGSSILVGAAAQVGGRPGHRSDPNRVYDYIIVGSGAGGGPLARRLVDAGFDVLVIEAGVSEVNQNVEVPAFHPISTEDPLYRWDYFVRHYDDPSAHGSRFQPDQDGMLYPRAGVVGGCTAHHALIGLYPNNADWRHLQNSTGDLRFHPDRMRWIYDNLVRQWLPSELPNIFLPLADPQLLSLVGATAEVAANRDDEWALFEALNGLTDPNAKFNVDNGTEGFFVLPKMTRNGKRYGARDVLMEAAARQPDRLTIASDTLVERILFDQDPLGSTTALRANGVECLQGKYLYAASPNSTRHNASFRQSTRVRFQARRDVILCAGAFNSPQLLMLSGIGDGEALSQHGIPTRLHLPGVGRNLQDRYETSVVSELPRQHVLTADCTFGLGADPCLDDYRQSPATTPYGSNGVVAGVFARSNPELEDPDLVLFGTPVDFRGYSPGYARKAFETNRAFSWSVLKGQTKNTSGRVTLRSADPTVRPAVNFNYFADGAVEDLAAVRYGVRLARSIMARFNENAELITGGLATEASPGPAIEDDAQLDAFIRKEAWGHHASCTNKMGPASDAMAVVDSNFRVHGTQNLRVVDASVFPKIPGLFITVPVYMLAEKAAFDILEGL